jgi:hypothetical protein
MAILNKPSALEKGVEYTFNLIKADILSLASVSAHSYYGNPKNWKSLALTYKSTEGSQYEAVTFHMDNSENILPAIFYVSNKSRPELQLLELTIHDFDGGYLKVKRLDIPDVENHDISLSSNEESSLFTYINNFNADAVKIGSLNSDDASPSIGQAFTMSDLKTVRKIQVRAKKNGAENSINLQMKIYDRATKQLVATSSLIPASDVGSSYSEISFLFDDQLPALSYYFLVVTDGSLSNTIDFLGKTSNSEAGGSLFASGSWYDGMDLDFKLLTSS